MNEIKLNYKGYNTIVHFDKTTKTFHGIIENIDDFVDFQTNVFNKIEEEFHNAVDDYIEFCSEINKTPEQSTTKGEKVMKTLFLDMDGTIASWEDFDIPRAVFEDPNFYLELEPCEKMIEAIRILLDNYDDVDIHILSAVINEESIETKNQWLDMYLPEIIDEKRHFVMMGNSKTDFIEKDHSEDYILIDDYTKNLLEWRRAGGLGIKFLNGDNGLSGKWTGDFISCRTDSDVLAKTIRALCLK